MQKTKKNPAPKRTSNDWNHPPHKHPYPNIRASELLIEYLDKLGYENDALTVTQATDIKVEFKKIIERYLTLKP